MKDSKVKIYFKDNAIPSVEGIVIFWNDKMGLLKNPRTPNQLLIYNPAQNVLMISILLENKKISQSRNRKNKFSPIIKNKTVHLYNKIDSNESIFDFSKNIPKVETSYYELPDFTKR